MAKGKKYDCRVVQDNSEWIAKITRRITSKKTVVSKSQGGFKTESDAQEWGEAELKNFSQNLNARNKRRSEQRKQKTEKK